MSSDELHDLWQSREVELASQAVPLNVVGIRRTTDLDPHIEVSTLDLDADWVRGVTAITYNGGYTTELAVDADADADAGDHLRCCG